MKISNFSQGIKSMLLALGLVISFVAQAEEANLPVEPEITIKREDSTTFYEYRINGILKEIKVVPKIGPEYYLVPSDGEGGIREDKSQLLVPKCVIFSW